MTTYPAHREADVALWDGSTVHVRPVKRTDAPAVEQLLKGLSDRSRWLRFFSGFPNLPKAASSGPPRSTTSAATDWSRPPATTAGWSAMPARAPARPSRPGRGGL